MSVFEFDTYKDYLANRLSLQRGLKSALARTLRCDPAYVTRVMQHDAEFSLEQADLINTFLHHNEEEKRYFLNLVNLARAGTANLQQFFNQEKKRLRKEHHEQSTAYIKQATQLSGESRTKYYSHWLYIVVDSLISSGICSTVNQMAKILNVEELYLEKFVKDLIEWNVLEMSANGLIEGKTHIFLDSHSPDIIKHHMNWRLQSIKSLDVPNKISTLHYSGVYTISPSDALAIKSKIISLIEDVALTVKLSDAKELHAFTLDFFQL